MRNHRGLSALLLIAVLPAGLLVLAGTSSRAADKKEVIKYARFQAGKHIAYGIVKDDGIHEIAGDLFTGPRRPTGKVHPVADVKLLAPTRPSKVLAMAGNYRSHLQGAQIPEKFRIPQLFFKPPSCLVGTGDAIVIPPGTKDVHYEGELVIVIGKKAKNVKREQALAHVLGVTCGNDVSARDWQKNDVQWWRAKGSDTFGPVGPYIVSGINYDNLLLQTRHNGEVKQKQRTNDLIHDVAGIVSFASQYVTLNPGDLIFTGTPGKTAAIKSGDEVEVEIEGVGVLRNRVK